MAWMTMVEAARELGVSVDTVDRRRKNGVLPGRQQPRPQGYIWLVELPDETNHLGSNGATTQADTPVDTQVSTGVIEALHETINLLKEEVATLTSQLAGKDEQIRELHVLLQQSQGALPVPKENRPWWRLW